MLTLLVLLTAVAIGVMGASSSHSDGNSHDVPAAPPSAHSDAHTSASLTVEAEGSLEAPRAQDDGDEVLAATGGQGGAFTEDAAVYKCPAGVETKVENLANTPESKQAFILTLAAGLFGVGRFYYGYTALGVVQLILGLIMVCGQCIIKCCKSDKGDEEAAHKRNLTIVLVGGVLWILATLGSIAWVVADAVMIANYDLLPASSCVRANLNI